MAGHATRRCFVGAVFATLLVISGCGDEGEPDQGKVRAACRAADEASVELDAAQVLGRSPDEVIDRFRRARRLAEAGGTDALSESLHEIILTIPDLKLEGDEHDQVVRIATIAHGVTGIVIACDDAGVEVTYSG